MYRVVLIAFVVVCSTTAAKYEKPSEDIITEITRNGETVCHAVLASPHWLVGLSDCVNEDRINKYKVMVGGTYERTITSKRMMDSEDSLALFSLSKKVKVEPAFIAKPDQLMRITSSKSLNKIIAEDVNIDVIPSKKCEQKGKYNRRNGQDLCYESMNKKSYTVVAGSPIMAYNLQRWSLIGLTLEGTCYSPALGLDLTKYRSWILEVLEEPIPCNPSEFRCSDGTCISNSKVCDGQMDCPCAGEDELSCGCSAMGKKFVFGFFNLRKIGEQCKVLTPSVYLTSTQPSVVQINGPNVNSTYSVDGSKRVVFPEDAYPTQDWNVFSGTVSNYSFELTSDNPITVVVVAACEEDTVTTVDLDRIDGTLVFPEKCMSNEYVVDVFRGYGSNGVSDIVAVGIEPETFVTILTPDGDNANATIGRGQMLSVSIRDRIKGSTVTADKNIAVFTGNSEVALDSNSRGVSFEHVPPAASLGKVYIVSIIAPTVALLYTITGAYDNTEVKLRYGNGDIYETLLLDKGAFYDIYMDQVLNGTLRSIVADKGILVSQYNYGARELVRFGAPSTVLLPALTHCESEYSFTLPVYMYTHTIVVYISECYGTDGLRLNGSPVTQAIFKTVDIPGFGQYNVVTINLTPEIDLMPHFATLSHTENGAKMCAILRSTRRLGNSFWKIGGLM